jgi:hypothetical protein
MFYDFQTYFQNEIEQVEQLLSVELREPRVL